MRLNAGVKLFLGLILVAVVGSVWAKEETPVKPDISYKKIARLLADRVPLVHLSHEILDDDIAAKAMEAYLTSLDYDHAYFLQEDVDRFKLHEAFLDDLLKRGSLDIGYRIFEVLKQRVANRGRVCEKIARERFLILKKKKATRGNEKMHRGQKMRPRGMSYGGKK